MPVLENNQNPDNAPDNANDDPSGGAKRVYERALEHHRAGRIEDAIADYTRVVRLLPLSADVYNNLGVALRTAGRAYAAVACYRRSLALKPRDRKSVV